MAVTAVQTRSGQSTGSSVNVAITTTAGNLLGVVTGGFLSNPSAPTRTGDTFSVGVSPFQDAGTDSIRGDYAMNIGGTSNNVVGNCSGGAACSVTEWTGALTTLALGAVNHAVSTSGTVQPGSITPTAGSGLMTGTNDDGSGSGASTINSSFTVDETGGAGTVWDESGPIAGSAHLNNAAASAVNPTWTSGHTSVGHMTALIMEFLSAGGGGGGSVAAPLLMMMGIGG